MAFLLLRIGFMDRISSRWRIKEFLVRDLPIGELARETGVKVSTIRFYEEIGLIPAASRTVSNRRSYGASDIRRLRFIRHARDMGFDLDDIRALLELAAHPLDPCGPADVIARRHLVQVEDKIARLVSLRDELQRMVSACGHGLVADCRIIEVLADHDLCDTDHGRVAPRPGATD
jgi:DNA-binding transcriptional MerR regulator